MQEVKIKGIYRHFKGDYYLVEDIGIHCDTLEKQVIYRGLYEDGPLWIRPYQDFIEEVNKEKYPKANQKYKFELQTVKSVRSKR